MRVKKLADLPLKPRLQLTFTAITALTVMVLSSFSLAFFYSSIQAMAVTDLKNKDEIAQTLLESKKSAIMDYAINLASDKTLQLLLDLDIKSKLSQLLIASAGKERKYHLTVFNTKEAVYSDVGYSNSQLTLEGRKISLAEQKLVTRAISGDRQSVFSQLSTALGQAVPAISAAVPITRDRRILGVLVVHFVLADNPEFFHSLGEALGVEVALHVQNSKPVGSPILSVSSKELLEMVSSGEHFQKVDLIGTGLDNYRVLKDESGGALGLLHLYQNGDYFRQTFLTALFFYLLFSILMMAAIAFIVIKTSRLILDPIGTLMTGVQKISEGDLRYEILLKVEDEIGLLGRAFNEMRLSLFEKIEEINQLNQSLEAKVKDRTEQIENLNSKLRHYLSPQVYASLVGGERDASIEKHYRKKLTVFFSDLVNFTATSDSMEPEDLSSILNNYLDQMSKIALAYGGTIDKYVGDAIMVFFGDPEFTSDKDHAVRAVGMSLDMLSKLDELRDEWVAKGVTLPFHVRIGINTGYCTVGNFGSETKMDYTIIGNNVNLAARYEAAAEKDTVLISHETYSLVRDEFEIVEIGEFTLKGIPSPVKAYRPLRRKAASKKGWISMGEGKLIFLTHKIDLSSASAEERKLLKRQLEDAADFLEDA